MRCTPVRTGASSAGSRPDAMHTFRLHNTLDRSNARRQVLQMRTNSKPPSEAVSVCIVSASPWDGSVPQYC